MFDLGIWTKHAWKKEMKLFHYLDHDQQALTFSWYFPIPLPFISNGREHNSIINSQSILVDQILIKQSNILSKIF